MRESHRTVFWAAAAGLAAGVGFWTYGWYVAVPATYSDLSGYGIEYGGEAFTQIAKNTQKLIRLVAIPLFSMVLISLAGWGYCIFTRPRRET
jgi:hypothetical protein